MTDRPGFSVVDCSMSPPRVSIPRAYNAAVDLIDRHVVQGRGHRTAIIDDRGAYCYAELAERTDRAAAALRDLGVEAEQRVLLCLLDTIDFPTVFFGALKAGAVAVPVSTLLPTADYAFLLADTRARVLVVSDALYPKFAPLLAAGALPLLKSVVVASSPGGPPAAPGTLALDALLAAARPAGTAPTTCEDAAFWLYTSGSTGTPKGAIHLHANLLHTAALYGSGILALQPEDVVFSAAKLFFAYGLGNSLTMPLHHGGTAILLAARPTPEAVMRVLVTQKPSIFCGVPTLFASLLADPALREVSGSPALRCSISAGEALPRHLGERWRARFGTDILDGIGSTEMLHIFLSNRPGQVRYGTTGQPVPGYELKLVDDDGAPTPDGAEGALWVRGPSSCSGYFQQRERSLQTFHGPWTRTGDRYVRDGDGFYTYCGRSDDMLKVGGIWVSPFEVESALAAHPAVLEVAVVGHPDAAGLTKPKAFVVLTQTAKSAAGPELAAALQAFVKERLAPHKYPRWIEFVSELPKTATGKTQRFKLRGPSGPVSSGS
jgi:benzoate-CoA ligase family protein